MTKPRKNLCHLWLPGAETIKTPHFKNPWCMLSVLTSQDQHLLQLTRGKQKQLVIQNNKPKKSSNTTLLVHLHHPVS